MSQNIFRVFLSSTFGDFQAEREYLRSHLWPKMEAWCAGQGASFQVVDLRWGITPATAFSHDTIKVCLDEVRRCQLLSPKPNFIMLIGDRYGWRPVPTAIPKDEFKEICSHYASDKKSLNLLKFWYRLDTNAIPPEYVLLRREGIYVDQDVWAAAESKLQHLLRSAVNSMGMTAEQKIRYSYSATHLEIVNGLLEFDDAEKHVFLFNRSTNKLPQSAQSPPATAFADYLPDGENDSEAQGLLNDLRISIHEQLPAEHIHIYDVDWIGTTEQPITVNHLEQFSDDMEQSLKQIIGEQFEELTVHKDQLTAECEAQEHFAVITAAILIGRGKELKEIHGYVRKLISKGKTQPLLIHGIAGNGKSALMAKAGDEIVNNYQEAVIVRRFVGATPRSWVVDTFLDDIIKQISREYGAPEPLIPEEGGLRKKAELFHETLKLGTKEKPLILFIDALDQFNSTKPVILNDLFPKELPAHVGIILSILDEQGKSDCERLVSHFKKVQMLELMPLKQKDSTAILEERLRRGDYFTRQRNITAKQKKALLAHAAALGSPLYTTLLAPMARRLKSPDKVPMLPDTVSELVKHIINEIASRHGYHELTIRALQYLKLSRFGLSEKELQDILWLDPEANADFQKTANKFQPEVTSLPPVIWSRLYAELDPYINEYEMDGQLLHRYFHRVFGEVAGEMPEGRKMSLHSRLADYFIIQPLHNDKRPNGRKVMELPYHLAHAGRLDEARTVITDFDFAMAKCSLNRSDDWVDDFRLVKGGELSREFRVWESFVRSNAHILRRGNEDWPAHKILLQLAVEHADDSPATIGAEEFLTEGRCDWEWLRRELRVKHAWIDPCVAVFEGRSGETGVGGALEMPDGKILTWVNNNYDHCQEKSTSGEWISYDKPLGLQDYSLHYWSQCGVHLRNMIGHTSDIIDVLILSEHKFLSWSSDCTLRIWAQEGEELAILRGHSKSVIGAHILTDTRILSWGADNKIILWNQDGELLEVLANDYEMNDEGKFQLLNGMWLSWIVIDCHVCLVDSDDIFIEKYGTPSNMLDLEKDKTLYWLPGENKLFIKCARSEEEILLEGHEYEISGAMCLPNKRILSWDGNGFTKYPTLRIWSFDGKELKVLQGHKCVVGGVLLLSDGRFLSWVNGNVWARDSAIRVWSADGDLLAELKGHSSWVNSAIQLRNGMVLSWAGNDIQDDDSLRLWDIDNIETFNTNKTLTLSVGHENEALALKACRCEEFVSWDDYSICVWSADGKLVEKIISESVIRGANLLDDGRIAYWDWNGLLYIYGKDRDTVLLEGHTNDINGAKSLEDGKIISWGHDSIIIWLPECKPYYLISGVKSENVIISDDGQLLSLTGENAVNSNMSLHLWNNNGTPIKVLSSENSLKGAILLSTGSILAWSFYHLHLFDRNGNLLKVIENDIRIVNAAATADGGFVHYDENEKLLLWDADGVFFSNISETSLLHNFPKIWDELIGEDKTGKFWSSDKTVMLGFTDSLHSFDFAWQGQSSCKVHRIYSDGRLMVTQANGQVCFLRTYSGNRRVSIEELTTV